MQFNDDEVKEILRRAIERDATRGGETGTQELMQIASELGVSTDDVSAAIAEVSTEREIQKQVASIEEQRRRALGGSAVTWLLVCSLLLLIDWMTGPGWWVQWPFAIWGVFIVFQTRRAFFASPARLRSKAQGEIQKHQKQLERAQRKQRHQKIELGVERALEKGVEALVQAATRHVNPGAGSPKPDAAQRQRVSANAGARGAGPLDAARAEYVDDEAESADALRTRR